MSTLKKCEGCGLISPDEKGLFIANHWYWIKYSHGIKDAEVGRFPRVVHKIDLCEDCFKKSLNAIGKRL